MYKRSNLSLSHACTHHTVKKGLKALISFHFISFISKFQKSSLAATGLGCRTCQWCESWANIATSYGLDSVPNRGKIFLSSYASTLALAPPKTPIVRVPGALSLGVKQQGHEADHSPPSVQIKNSGAILPFPHISSRHSA
jgi:hypothetical protein